MTRTFCDAGVLIAAARSVGPDRLRALQLLEEPDRVFLTSPFIHLEVVPKTIFYKKRLEQSFYDRYFNNAVWFRQLDKIDALLRQQLFFYRDLWAWLDAPFEAPPALAGVHDDGQQLEITW